ncbi:Tetratricopeptide (TPR) repeat [Micromonospora pallida]|uniref:Tetratricopeptide (TPR) repeat n=1 Tax=Micromonospora pallida TaxID=145854 RepID=A0A1C6TIG0_9ACTN|nr:tetratricopeptide repeat protein [Micromonospora pallida]SCL41529.1 Tetratricopeptide (TPR) repeat [Micromonospora pallida]
MSASTPDPPGVSNRIADGVFFNAVVMGRDIQVTLPAEIRPALTGLPRPAAVFTGREQQVDALLRSLSPDGEGGKVLVSAVAGMAGVGKTELVVQTAQRALRESGWFPGGVLFVDMFGYDPDRCLSAADALQGWLQAIGIPGEHIPASEQDRARLWRSVLDAYTSQDRRLLLVIDNARTRDQVVPLLPADPAIAVLVTSRHTLNIDARLHDLNVLDSDAAVALIREVIAQRRGADDPRLHAPDQQQTMADLAELCAGLPLALRVVAALLADRPHLQPAALADRLRDDQARLDGLSRQEIAVRAAFDLSYQHLTDDQALLYRLMPVNPGLDIATEAAAALTDLPTARVAVLLEDLHRAHLVDEPAADRWRMHDLVRLHAAGQSATSPDGTHTARHRLFTHYLHATQAASTHLVPTGPADTTRFPSRQDALRWLDAEHDNLVSACVSAPTHDLPHIATGLASALGHFLYFRRHFIDWITVATNARDIFHQLGDRHGEGATWGNLGIALQQVRRFDEAITAHTNALDIFHQLGDHHGEGQVWSNLGIALAEVRRYDEAITAHTYARDILHQLGDRHGEGQVWDSLGIALQQVRRFDEAITAHINARDILHQLGDHHGEGTAWGNLGVALTEVRRYDEAITAHTNALDIHHRLGDHHREGQAWGNLGIALRQVHRYDEAITAHTNDLEICHQLGDRHGEGRAWNNLGIALRQVHRYDEAITAHTNALDIHHRLGDHHREGQAWSNLGIALAEVRRYDEAITAHTNARDILHQLGDHHGEGQVWDSLGSALQQVGRFDEAITAHTNARDIHHRLGDRHREGQAWGALGIALGQVRRFDEARSCWEQAVDAFIETGDAESATLIRTLLDPLES